jgi:hypothetical protein
LPLEENFLFSPLFSGLIPTLQSNALLGESLLLGQNDKPMRPMLLAALPPTLPTLLALLHMLQCTCLLSGAIQSLHAWHEQQRFLFLAELLV